MSKVSNSFYGLNSVISDACKIAIVSEENSKKDLKDKSPLDLLTEEIEKEYQTHTLAEETVREALKVSNGWLSKAAELLNVPIGTVQYAIFKSPKLQIYLNDLRQSILDFAENELMKKVKEGDRESIIYLLRCHGKQRGWNDKAQEHQIQDAAKIVINIQPAVKEEKVIDVSVGNGVIQEKLT